MEEEREFLEKYGFTNFQTITVSNPTSEDYHLKITIDTKVDRATGKMGSDQREFIIKAGGTERLAGHVANKYLDEMCKLLAQEDRKMGLGAVVNFTQRAKLYDDLIVEVEDLLNKQYISIEDENKTAARVEEAKEETFAGARKNGGK